MKNELFHLVSSRTLLARLIDSPDLVQTIRSLDEQVFSSLVRKIGVEDAGELVALATTEQLVAAYLSNVLAAGAGTDHERLRASEATEAALATIAFGAELVVQQHRAGSRQDHQPATSAELCSVLEACPADILFRKASSELVRTNGGGSLGFVRSRAELAQLARLSRPAKALRAPTQASKGAKRRKG